ncbi:MAG: hypothetical protein ACXVCY_16050 [Pseudobdellovibrionaceae bacterium]
MSSASSDTPSMALLGPAFGGCAHRAPPEVALRELIDKNSLP